MFFVVVGIISLLFIWKKKFYRWIYILLKTSKRDLRGLVRFAKFNIRMFKHQRNNDTVVKVFSKLSQKHPEKVCFYYENEVWTYKRLNDFSDKIGTYFKNAGFKAGDSIALMMTGKPEYVGLWLGLSKIGVVTALINTNLTKDPLIHSIKAGKVKGIIYGQEVSDALDDIYSEIKYLKLFQWTDDTQDSKENSVLNLKKEVDNVQAQNLETYFQQFKSTSKLMYIYTSGTTGLPKAAIITNNRFLFMASAMNIMTDIKENDIVYDPLPLYHSAGGIVGVGQAVICGSTVAIRKKFSASNFWKDCAKYNCNVAQYIGEICRYLLAIPKSTDTINKTVTKMMGNGLKPQIWNQFVSRFGIKDIYEVYGSTEGNSNLINLDNKAGAVGFTPRYANRIYPVTLVKCDDEGNPIRNKDGFCTRCQVEEPGVFIGKIYPKMVLNEFVGYADEKATDKKIIRDVFKKGDTYFNSGDILVQDEFGYYYFKDRTGDTFRWKGENVSTSEVEAVVSNIVNLNDAVVYGVEIPNTEGRAGMAAIVDIDRVVNVEQLGTKLRQSLPTYAMPIFLRLMDSVPLTGTFKLKKNDLQAEGFNVHKLSDRIFYYDFKANQFKELTRELYNDIMTGLYRI